MNKNILFSVLGLGVACSSGHKQIEQVKKRPNIVFIMTDDHTTQAMSCYGSNLIKTPNLDRIAKQGVIFNNCYVTNGISAPSRACILTGKFSHINGVTDNSKVFDGTQQTYTKILKENGYQTSMIGKWHLGSEPTGFDYYSILLGQGNYYNPDFFENGKIIHQKGYVTDIITDKAISWIKKRDTTKPFCLIYQHKAPHRNWMPAQRHLGAFENITFPEPKNLFDKFKNRGSAAKEQEMLIADHMWEAWDFKIATAQELENFGKKNKLKKIKNAKQHDVLGANKREQDLQKFYRVYSRMDAKQKENWNKTYSSRIKDFRTTKRTDKELTSWKFQCYMKDYLSCLLSVDENVGRLLDYLEKIGEINNTIIVYTSDQGFFLGEHGYFDKRIMYDEAYRMPLIISYPNKIGKGLSSNALCMNVDFAPTLLDYAGIEIPTDMQGVSLKPLLNNSGEEPENWRSAVYYHYFEFPSWHSVKRHYGIRTKTHKLIHFYNNVNEWELYNLVNDPREMNNIYSNPKSKKIVTKLKQELKKLQKQYKDTDPTERTKEYFKGIN